MTDDKKPKRGGRDMKKAFTSYLYDDAYWRVRELAVQRKTTVQALMEEAVDLLFEKVGDPMRASDSARLKAGLETYRKE
ncbi:ribbon-helix-helix domain-containing protein [Microvirga pudoricolor]|uniref:ribbon-helix-helix domain-containing protein n=1 Tax=Microvirga pudoricolor TaxID=2778729 RepID=UPI00194DFC92|nr:ribbon-helix-helix domain-containing protein [Microvirga pudoricolor]MBM6595580.1 hypothetical protein [Microvirga pudoricolor]